LIVLTKRSVLLLLCGWFHSLCFFFSLSIFLHSLLCLLQSLTPIKLTTSDATTLHEPLWGLHEKLRLNFCEPPREPMHPTTFCTLRSFAHSTKLCALYEALCTLQSSFAPCKHLYRPHKSPYCSPSISGLMQRQTSRSGLTETTGILRTTPLFFHILHYIFSAVYYVFYGPS